MVAVLVSVASRARCLRRDKMTEAMQAFVVDVMGQFFVEPPTFNLKACYDDSSVTMPLIFVLSTGSDPNKVRYPIPTPCHNGGYAPAILRVILLAQQALVWTQSHWGWKVQARLKPPPLVLVWYRTPASLR